MSAKRVEYQQGAVADVKSAVAPGDVGSVRSRPKHQIKTRSFGERPEVSVARKERNATVDTALGDQRVAEARPAALCQHVRPQRCRPLPIAWFDLNQRHFCESFGNRGGKLRVA